MGSKQSQLITQAQQTEKLMMGIMISGHGKWTFEKSENSMMMRFNHKQILNMILQLLRNICLQSVPKIDYFRFGDLGNWMFCFIKGKGVTYMCQPLADIIDSFQVSQE